MTSVSSLGIGSGLDLTTLLDGITTSEQAPLAAIQQQQTSYTTKLSAYGQLSAALSTLQTASAALAAPALFQGVTATSSATNVLSATALSSATGGAYAVNVTQLAQAQSLVAAGQTSTTTAIGTAAATLTLDFGTISGGTLDPATGTYTGAGFDPDATRTATSLTIKAKSSLADIRDAINGNAAIGVTASIVNDGSSTPYRLVLTSNQTGEASSMRIAVTGDTTLSNLLANNPKGLPDAQLKQTAAAQNTQLTVNGIGITSATSSVTDAVPGVTMTIANAGSSTLFVQNDTSSVKNAVTNFVNAYNNLQSVAGSLTAFDASTQKGAVLLGDSTLRNIQVGIRSALTSAQKDDGSGLTMLSQIGISFQNDGTLSLDSTKLGDALGGKMSGVANLFTGGTSGFGTKMSSLIDSYTNTSTGSLTATTTGINTTLTSLSKQYTDTSSQVDAIVARYKAQFTQLDVLISSMNQTSSYLTQQFDALNNTTNGK